MLWVMERKVILKLAPSLIWIPVVKTLRPKIRIWNQNHKILRRRLVHKVLKATMIKKTKEKRSQPSTTPFSPCKSRMIWWNKTNQKHSKWPWAPSPTPQSDIWTQVQLASQVWSATCHQPTPEISTTENSFFSNKITNPQGVQTEKVHFEDSMICFASRKRCRRKKMKLKLNMNDF